MMLIGFFVAIPALNVIDVGAFSAAKLLPIENKDAFFASPPHFYGVFDGVSQCPQSRSFAQTLAKTACAKLGSSVRGELMDQVQPALWQALGDAQQYKGCSTACVMRVDLQREQPVLGCFNLGDCVCMVLRPGESALAVAETTDIKMHANGAPYQLGGLGWKTDKIEDGLTFSFDVNAGDVVLCFSDGVANNLTPDEIAQISSACARQPASELAKTLVESARQKKLVDDDATVVALRLGEGSGPTQPILTDEAPWEKFGVRLFGPASLHSAAAPVVVRSAAPKLALDAGLVSHAVDSASNLLSVQVFGLDTNPYGGVSSFSQSATGSGGDLNFVLAVGVLFPTAVTLAIYKDNVMSMFEPPVERELPKGWKKVPSQSRPGKFSYLNTKTKERYDRVPNSAYDD